MEASPCISRREVSYATDESANIRTAISMMQVVQEYSHRFGSESLEAKGLATETRGLVSLPSIRLTHGAARQINRAFQSKLSSAGWAMNVKVDPQFPIKINAIKNRVAVTLQTGNITRAFYDLLKFEAMYIANRIDSAVLILPSREAARELGSNIANFQRVTSELNLFQHVFTVPCLVLGVDE